MAQWSRELIAQLIEEGSWTARAKSLERLATRFAEERLEEAEWLAITDAFRIALYDAEPLVRRVLAESVKSVSAVPRDILVALARDVAPVAAPVLQHSRLLSEDDLMQIVVRGTSAHRLAIAGRPLLSGRVAEALLSFGERSVILQLVANDGAAISETALHRLIDQYAETPAIIEGIAKRRLLPVSIGSRLYGNAARRSEAAARPRLRLAGSS
jgi:uncharacterized protein (DUF2336 family)